MKLLKFVFENGIIGLFVKDKTYSDFFYKIGYAFGYELGLVGLYLTLFVNFLMFPF